MIEVKHKDGEMNVKILGRESVVLAELTCATRTIYDFIAGRRGKDTANQMLENVFRRERMSEEEIEKELAESKEIVEKFYRDRFNPGGIL